MSRQLAIGSIVQLKNGNTKLMIISRFPLYKDQEKIGYFDYSACIYPTGTFDNRSYFFNEENIEKVWFKGYVDETEEMLQKRFETEKSSIKYPRLEIEN